MSVNRFEQLCLWTDESLALCQELVDLLGRERTALILLKGEDLAEITMTKEVLVRKIVDVRRRIREAGKAWFGVESSVDLEKQLPDQQKKIWAEKHAQWTKQWSFACEQAQSSQLFLEHSQRNLGRLIDHWRRLIGDAPLYSSQGKKKDPASTGRVLERKY